MMRWLAGWLACYRNSFSVISWRPHYFFCLQASITHTRNRAVSFSGLLSSPLSPVSGLLALGGQLPASNGEGDPPHTHFICMGAALRSSSPQHCCQKNGRPFSSQDAPWRRPRRLARVQLEHSPQHCRLGDGRRRDVGPGPTGLQQKAAHPLLDAAAAPVHDRRTVPRGPPPPPTTTATAMVTGRAPLLAAAAAAARTTTTSRWSTASSARAERALSS